MAKALLTDELGEVIEPLLPPPPPKPRGGRPRISNRAALTGILFVRSTGLQWELLPQEIGCGSGMTCWRRLRDWQAAGVWEKLHRVLLDKLNGVGEIDWSRASLDSASIRAKKGVKQSGRLRRIRANQARSAILWSAEREFPSRYGVSQLTLQTL
jgi:transposase